MDARHWEQGCVGPRDCAGQEHMVDVFGRRLAWAVDPMSWGARREYPLDMMETARLP